MFGFNPWLIVVAGVVVLGAFAGGYLKGRHDVDMAYKAAALEAAQRVIDDVVAQSEVTAAVAEKAEEKQAEIRTVTRTIVKEVKRYVPVEVDRGCPIPVGFVGLHDAAAAGRAPVPDAAREPHGPASAVRLSDVGRTVVENYGTCHEIRQRLIDLQDWIRQQRALWARPP